MIIIVLYLIVSTLKYSTVIIVQILGIISMCKWKSTISMETHIESEWKCCLKIMYSL